MIEQTLSQLLTAIQELTAATTELSAAMTNVVNHPKAKPRKKAETEAAPAPIAEVAPAEVVASIQGKIDTLKSVSSVIGDADAESTGITGEIATLESQQRNAEREQSTPEPIAEVVPPVAEPTPAPEPVVTWEETLDVIKNVNTVKGRPAVVDILTEFGLDPMNGGTVPKLKELNRNAEIKAFAEKLLAE